jgi:hypothetical protein
MTSWALTFASAIAALIALAHSYLGERRILQPLAAMGMDFGTPERRRSVNATLRFAWHLTSLFWLGAAMIIGMLASRPLDPTGVGVLGILGTLYIASSAIVLASSGGRHMAWPLLLLVGMIGWAAVIDHGGKAAIAASTNVIGLFVVITLLAIAALHGYWVGSGSAGSGLAVPRKDGVAVFKPGPVGTGLVAVALMLAAAMVVGRLGYWRLPYQDSWLRTACWMLSAVFILRAIGDFRFVGFFKRVVGSPFARWDTAAYSPLCLLLGLGIAAVNLLR